MKWKIGIGAAIAVSVLFWLHGYNALSQTGTTQTSGQPSAVFSPAHSSIGVAVRHFFGVQPVADQPIVFAHNKHIVDAQMECTDCHLGVRRGPKAGLPDIRMCWSCHVNTLTDHPEIKKVRAYHDKGQDIPWQRVFGWNDEAHVRFNHAPHIRAQVDCSTCHGDLSTMTTAQRVVTHTMAFCVDCHKQRQIRNDCTTCHY